MQIKRNYDEKAQNDQNLIKRQHSKTYDLKAFNNWIKSVLINKYTSQMCSKIQKQLDLHRGHKDSKLLHVLDIGCGRGQDIKKWKFGRVSYMVATDFSQQCIKKYEQRWQQLNQPYKLYTIVADFTSPDLYSNLDHSYYDIISSQFSFHYMFSNLKNLKQGLANILSNLLVEGVFMATVPDSYTILHKIKQKGIKNQLGQYTYGNKYFSMKFKNINFYSPYGNQYGFYLEQAVGNKNQDGTIQYTQQWLISLDHLQQLLKTHGVIIQYTVNFLDFYKQYREQYKYLFSKFKLSYAPGQHMQQDLWEIVHLYRVIVCRKVSIGKSINEFGINQRQKSIKQIYKKKNQFRNDGNRNQYYDTRNNNDNYRGKRDPRKHHIIKKNYEHRNDRYDKNDRNDKNDRYDRNDRYDKSERNDRRQ